ncbi:MAG: hypothetical protein ACHP79_06965 [Terriglobales bacterium]
MPEQELTNRCQETGRALATAEEARASEARFREIQAECDAGRVPELRPGDVIYVETELYLGHGRDDFRGGLAEVLDVRANISAGKPTPFVCIKQQPDSWQNWAYLAAEQQKLHAEFGKNWSYPDPDNRPEFNDW